MTFRLPTACLSVLLACGLATPVLADELVQKYVRADGSVMYTNLPAGMVREPGMRLLEVRVFKDYHYTKRPRRLTAARRDAYDGFISAASQNWGVEFALIKAIMHAESLFDTEAVSVAGARGLMQLMPDTAKDLGVSDLKDPGQNIGGGVRYLRSMLDRYDGDLSLALAAYNAGPGNVDRYEGIPPFEETQMYVKRVQDLFEQYRTM